MSAYRPAQIIQFPPPPRRCENCGHLAASRADPCPICKHKSVPTHPCDVAAVVVAVLSSIALSFLIIAGVIPS